LIDRRQLNFISIIVFSVFSVFTVLLHCETHSAYGNWEFMGLVSASLGCFYILHFLI